MLQRWHAQEKLYLKQGPRGGAAVHRYLQVRVGRGKPDSSRTAASGGGGPAPTGSGTWAPTTPLSLLMARRQPVPSTPYPEKHLAPPLSLLILQGGRTAPPHRHTAIIPSSWCLRMPVEGPPAAKAWKSRQFILKYLALAASESFRTGWAEAAFEHSSKLCRLLPVLSQRRGAEMCGKLQNHASSSVAIEFPVSVCTARCITTLSCKLTCFDVAVGRGGSPSGNFQVGRYISATLLVL